MAVVRMIKYDDLSILPVFFQGPNLQGSEVTGYPSGSVIADSKNYLL